MTRHHGKQARRAAFYAIQRTRRHDPRWRTLRTVAWRLGITTATLLRPGTAAPFSSTRRAIELERAYGAAQSTWPQLPAWIDPRRDIDQPPPLQPYQEHILDSIRQGHAVYFLRHPGS